MDLYHNTAFSISKIITNKYSTSFSMGIMAFAPKYRDPIYGIYAYVRFADEIVDTFHDFNKKELLQRFRKDTFQAIEDGISLNPVLHAFQKVVNEYQIDHKYIIAFLDSMEMDLSNSYYEQDGYNNYIYGSAEVVGLMCLKVFVDGDQQQFDALLEPARALGSAFQKVNFLRDIKSDIEERGRIYLPGVDSSEGIDEINKARLEKEVEEEFALALEGIKKLTPGVRMGVYSAYLYYIKLFEKIRSSHVSTLLKKRVRVSNVNKFALFLQSMIEVKVLKTT
ncbi:MAG: phytoene/squalene synthase family protein [Ignavibacteriales bacterium]|nr:MAG: phytoene/squalene synthase family protein [Ignavibacteriales bacterium]